MASRSSPSTHSPRTTLKVPSQRSRAEIPGHVGRDEPEPRDPGPAEKKHKNLDEVRRSGRQSDQGGRPRSAR
jgi:hypothetical protein